MNEYQEMAVQLLNEFIKNAPEQNNNPNNEQLKEIDKSVNAFKDFLDSTKSILPENRLLVFTRCIALFKADEWFSRVDI